MPSSSTLQRKQSQNSALLFIKVQSDALPPQFYDLGCRADNSHSRCVLGRAGADVFPCLCLFRSRSNITICLPFDFISLSLSSSLFFSSLALRCKKKHITFWNPSVSDLPLGLLMFCRLRFLCTWGDA